MRAGKGQKRLMLLGGSRYILPVIKAAHELGIYVITADYLPDNIAHRYSDEYRNVSIIEKDKVLACARELHIDGIMSFACDPGVVTAAYVAEKMGLPSVGSYKSVCILQNKGKFRRFLEENGFNVPTAKSYRTAKDAIEDAARFHWPVIVKPVDSAGSKCVTRVDRVEDLPDAVSLALGGSFSGEFIVEDYLEKAGCTSDCDSFSVDGELRFVSFNAQRFDDMADNPYVPAAFSWPTTISAEHQKELKAELQRLIKLLRLRSSIYNIETRECTDGKAYIMECSPRGGGNRLAEIVRLVTGVDMIKAAILAAAGDPVEDIEQRPFTGNWAEVILHSNRSGTYKQLWIEESVRKYVIEEDVWVKPGDPVERFQSANKTLGTLILRFDTREELDRVMSQTNQWLEIELTGGTDSMD